MGPKRDNKKINPFPGLRPFAPEDSNLFFGRESESDEVISKLLKNRYITVIGSSGNGKTSLIYGGVIPKIRDKKIRESSLWKVVSSRPGNDPFGNLAGALSEGISDQGLKSADKDQILSDLLNDKVTLSDLLRKFTGKHDENILIVIDQFEDIFRNISPSKPENSEETKTKFVDFLVNTLTKSDLNIFFIISISSEYMGGCSHYKGLTMLINNSNYLLPEMTAENYRSVIEGPINYAGAKIDSGLVESLLTEIASRPFPLPVLQLAMLRTWERWRELEQPDKPLSSKDYELAGDVTNVVSLLAEEVYEELNQRGKEICAALFKTITGKGSDNKGLRNPADLKTIRSIAKCSDVEILSVIDKFRQRSVSILLPPDNIVLTENSLIDLQNECLTGLWKRLKNWVDDEAASKEMYMRLSEVSALYQQGKAGLLRSPDIEAAILWRNSYKPTLDWAVQYNPAFERAMVYLRTSEKSYLIDEQNKKNSQTRNAKRNRFITRILSIAILISSGIILYAYGQKLAAERQSRLSENGRVEAVKGKELADSFALIVLEQKIISDSTASASFKMAEEAKQQKIVSDVQKSFAEKNAREALLQKKLLAQKSDSMKAASIRAEQNAKLAIEQRSETQRLRMLSIGRSMSLKSLQLAGQKDIQTLLAYQAYIFNKRNNGQGNDADIYSGLYNAGLQYDGLNYHSFKGHNGDIRSIAFLPGKKEFFTSGNDGQVLKWSLENRDQTLQVVYSGSDIIEVLAVSPDASWLACGSSNSSIRMIPLKGNISGYEMTGHKGGIKSLIFSYDGKYLYSAALDGKVLKWDIAARTSINVATGSMEITSIDISSMGNYLAGISADGSVVVLNQEHNTENFSIETTGRNIKVVRFNPENNLLALGDADGTVELWDVNLRKKLSEVKAHGGQVNDIRFNTALKQMATSGNDKKLKIFNINDPADLTEPPVTLADNQGFVLVMQFSPDGQMIVSGESGGGNNVIGRPTHVDYLVSDICNMISRNMTQEEWNNYVAKDIPLEKTCQGKNFNIKVEPIKAMSK
jgi:WD40 repeat protein